jgi:hypothetical protein
VASSTVTRKTSKTNETRKIKAAMTRAEGKVTGD